MRFIKIGSDNDTDVLINAPKISSVQKQKNGCRIYFDNGTQIITGASFEEIVDAIERIYNENEGKKQQIP